MLDLGKWASGDYRISSGQTQETDQIAEKESNEEEPEG
jgi:endogenous inhibitor of DNA gyrase (YacG/DUF329 family)